MRRLPRRVSDAKESDGPPREAGRENRPLPQVWLPRGRCPSIADHRRTVLWLRPTEDGERTRLQLQGVSKPLERFKDVMNKDRLFRDVGEAIYLGQMLELNIRVLISILNLQFHAGIDERQLIIAEDRQTLGQLIREMKKHGDLNQKGADILSEALEARNYIAHHFFTRSVTALTREDACASALALLDKHTKHIAAATAITSGFVQAFCQTFKIKLSDVLVKQDF